MCVPCLPTILDWTMSIITINVCAYEPDGCVNQGVTEGLRVIAILTIVVHVLEITIQCFVKDGEAFNYNPPTFNPKSFWTAVSFTIIHLIKFIVVCAAIIPNVKPSVVDDELNNLHNCSNDVTFFGPVYAFITFMLILYRTGLHYCHMTYGAAIAAEGPKRSTITCCCSCCTCC